MWWFHCLINKLFQQKSMWTSSCFVDTGDSCVFALKNPQSCSILGRLLGEWSYPVRVDGKIIISGRGLHECVNVESHEDAWYAAVE